MHLVGIMKLITLLKGKIHRLKVTGADLNYVGSISIDSELMEKSGIVENELVHVWNVTNGARIETYALEATRGSGIVCINGAAAHRFNVGDIIIVTAFVLTDEQIEPKVVLVDEETNKFLRYADPHGERSSAEAPSEKNKQRKLNILPINRRYALLKPRGSPRG